MRFARVATALTVALFVAPLPRASAAARAAALQSDGKAPLAESAQTLDPKQCGIGEQVPDLSFVDLDGKAGRLSDYADRHALVVVIRDVGCPVSKLYGLRTAEIEQSYAARGVAFLYVDTGKHDSVDACRGEAKEYRFAGRYARELEGRFGFALQVRTTTDVFVLDGERRLRYRGAIDDQIGRGVQKAAPTHEYLKDALEAVLARKSVDVAATSAPGCELSFTTEPPKETPPAAPTWNGSIARIVQTRCQGCHRTGGPAPFVLTAPDDLEGRKVVVRKRLVDHQMPPWYLSKETSGNFSNEVAMPDDERLALLQWLQADAPLGDPKDAPPPREFKEGWLIGEPDLVVPIPEPVDIPATGIVDYLNVAAPTNLDHDVWIQAMQIRCENPGICHHVLCEAFNEEERVQDFLDSYLPGKGPTVYPEGQAMLLHAGSMLHFNLHYTPNGKPCKETTKIGFKFAKETPKLRVTGRILRGRGINIPPNRADYGPKVVEKKMPFDCDIRKLIPHMHLRGSGVKIELAYPDGRVDVVLDMAKGRWHPDWQYAYEFKQPVHVPKDTVIRCSCWFDNSSNNPFNLHPEKWVRDGPQIEDEMSGTFVEWTRPANLPNLDAPHEKPDGVAPAVRPKPKPKRHVPPESPARPKPDDDDENDDGEPAPKSGG